MRMKVFCFLLAMVQIVSLPLTVFGKDALIAQKNGLMMEATQVVETIETMQPVGTPPPTVPPSEWARADVERAKEIGIVERVSFYGYPHAIKRKDFCDLIYNLIEVSTDKTFDVQSESTFEDTDNPKVLALYSLGIINGKSETRFAPSDYLTRQEAATIIVRMIDKCMPMVATEKWFAYSDMEEIAPWASNAVQRISNLGFMKGVGENRFAPQEHYTVEQAVVTLVRVYDALVNQRSASEIIAPLPIEETVELDDFYIEEALTLIEESKELAADRDFISLYTTNDATTDQLLKLGAVDFQNPNEIFYLSVDQKQLVENIKVFAGEEAENIDFDKMELLNKRYSFSSLSSLINGSYGTETLAAMVILSHSRGYLMPEDFKEDFALYLEYEGDYSALVEFSEYGVGVIRANMSFVRNGEKDNVFRRIEELVSYVGDDALIVAKVK